MNVPIPPETVVWPDWVLDRPLGAGSFGTVYQISRQLLDGTTEYAAMKVISIPRNPSDLSEWRSEGYSNNDITLRLEDYRNAILREYGMMARMKGHANVVYADDIRCIPRTDGPGWKIYIKMELLTPLAAVLGDMTPDRVVRLGNDISAALTLCRRMNVLHRDIKPQNIFVGKDGTFKLGDFGVAKYSEQMNTGTTVGTYKFMAPEIYANQPYGHTADLYSLGLVLYWLLNEKRGPFLPLPGGRAAVSPGAESNALERRFRGEPLPPPAHGGPQLQSIVLRACAFRPEDRFQTAEELHAALWQLQHGGGLPDSFPQPFPTPPVTQEKDPTTDVGTVRLTKPGTVPPANSGTVPPTNSGTIPPVIFGTVPNTNPGTVPPTNPGPVPPAPPQPGPREDGQKSVFPRWLIWVLVGVLLLGGILTAVILLLSGSSESSSGQPSAVSPTSVPASQAQGSDAAASAAPASQPDDGSHPFQLNWTDWSDTLPAFVTEEDYLIETRTLYRSAVRDYTTAETDRLEGWELYGTVYEAGELAPPTEWSTEPIPEADGVRVEEKTQYQYVDSTVEEKITGWETGPWQAEREEVSDRKQEETSSCWGYYFYLCPHCYVHMPEQGICARSNGGCGGEITAGDLVTALFPSAWTENGQAWNGTSTVYYVFDDEIYFAWNRYENVKSYRYRTAVVEETTVEGKPSEWLDEKPADQPGRTVRTRTVYGAWTQAQVPVYQFRRWGDWTDWSETPVTPGEDIQVETSEQFRYRSRTS